MRGRVEKLLLPILHTGAVGIERIAGLMGPSRQTVYRNLRARASPWSRCWTRTMEDRGAVIADMLVTDELTQSYFQKRKRRRQSRLARKALHDADPR